MSHQIQVRKSWSNRHVTRLVALSLLLSGVAGCAQVPTQPVDSATPTPSTVPTIEVIGTAAWQTYTGGESGCVYVISFPSDMESGTLGWMYSWILRYYDLVLPPPEVANNFIYVSVLPEGAETDGVGVIINYESAEVETLLHMEIGESKALGNDPNTAQENIYTRLPDIVIANQVAQAYENTRPLNLPTGIKELRYYFKANVCGYLIGAYLNPDGSDQPGAISEELFEQIMATFDLIP